jgi:hypothetical protein
MLIQSSYYGTLIYLYKIKELIPTRQSLSTLGLTIVPQNSQAFRLFCLKMYFMPQQFSVSG